MRPKRSKSSGEKTKTYGYSLEPSLYAVVAAHGGASKILREFAQERIEPALRGIQADAIIIDEVTSED